MICLHEQLYQYESNPHVFKKTVAQITYLKGWKDSDEATESHLTLLFLSPLEYFSAFKLIDWILQVETSLLWFSLTSVIDFVWPKSSAYYYTSPTQHQWTWMHQSVVCTMSEMAKIKK